MNRNKKIGITIGIIAILVVAYFVGMYPYRSIFGPYPAIEGVAPGIAPSGEPVGKEIIAQRADEVSFEEERMIIYNAYISLETKDIDGGLAKIRILTEDYGGYVAGTHRSTYGQQERADISIRIPQDNFRTAVNEIESYGRLLDERTTSEDITERYIDLKARLSNLEKQEKRLLELLDIAKTVEEIIEVEKELSRVRGEIERLQGQINYLERHVEMSLISVSLIEPLPPFTPPGMDWGETFELALMGLFGVVRGLIILIVSLLPFIIVGAIIYYVYKIREKKKKKR